ncbi:hypothetical protein EW146_g10001 [Bondarzewia mesenterica]|uniref:Protein-S-isoprenylcysteine O-methyltransferase n=1 Tax=Bondarzewia mesenterica TaxID=1095465 RepID=A0A4S4L2Q5_9AGAM|nr:hypothetical protein EW146_g10001 [Bondarzewia mesenterica]
MPFPSFKLLSLATTALTHYYSTAPPIPPPGPDDEVYTGQPFEKMIPALRRCSMIALTIALACEYAVLASFAYPGAVSLPAHLYETLCPRSMADGRAFQSMPPVFLAGLSLTVTGCLIRLWCYKVLGKIFTYEVTLRPSHMLVTHGPYAYVRHPSYTGLYMHFGGIAVLHFSPGGWNRECGIMSTLARWWIGLWLVLTAFTFASVWRRSIVEDKIMKKKFGSQWEQYRRDVPFKILPGII